MLVGLVAGEESGDILGADFIQAFQQQFPHAKFIGVGGRRMKAAGMDCWYDVEVLSVMGLTEVLKHLPRLLRLRKDLMQRFVAAKPDFVIGIDAPDFNIGLESRLKAQGIKTAHYVSPSVWAWREKRIYKIKEAINLMLTLFPFEQVFYQKHKVPVACVGHSMADQIATESIDKETEQSALGLSSKGPVIAVLPGSRMSEVSRLGEVFSQAAKRLQQRFPNAQLITATPNDRVESEWQRHLADAGLTVQSFPKKSRQVIMAADFALVASGTVTLECMLAKTPLVMAYKVSGLTYWIANTFNLVKIKRFSLPNLLAGKNLIEEYIQDDATAENLGKAMIALVEEGGENMVAEFVELAKPLRKNAGLVATEAIKEYLLCK